MVDVTRQPNVATAGGRHSSSLFPNSVPKLGHPADNEQLFFLCLWAEARQTVSTEFAAD